MSKVESTLRWLEAAGDHMNAILVKETRQSLKSKQFVASFLLLVFASWVISVFGVALMGDSINYGASGQQLFYFYFVVLMIAITVIVPYGAYRSMLGEKDQNTFDSLRITSLSPWQIVWGKLLSAVLQDFIYYSAIAPFIAFTSLLEGFELPAVAFVLLCGFLISIVLSIMALMISTFANQRHWQGVLSIMLLIGLLSILGQSSAVLLSLFNDSSILQSWEFWSGFGISVLLGISYCWLFLQITAAQLTFESGNRSTGIRMISSVQFLLMNGLAWGLYMFYGSSIDDDLFYMLITITYVQLVAVGLVSVTEEDHLSRRIRKALPPRPLYRALLAPFLPGGSLGMIYFLANLGICVGLQILTMQTIVAFGGFRSSNLSEFIAFLTGLSFYLIIYLGFASAFSRLAIRTSDHLKPNHVRVITVLVFAIGCVIPIIVKAMEVWKWRQYSLFEVTNPFLTLMEISERDAWRMPVLTLLFAFATIALLLNLKSMMKNFFGVIALKTEATHENVQVQPFQIPEESPTNPAAEG